ncbi:MAG: hypothetical protein L0Z50_35045 [Verrucomicrobiales bacterium]|nr:hypothetical protein [Verrucomicrobiales bacterium]
MPLGELWNWHAGQHFSHAHFSPGLHGFSSPLELLLEDWLLSELLELLLEELLLEELEELLDEDFSSPNDCEELLEDGIARPLGKRMRRTHKRGRHEW